MKLRTLSILFAAIAAIATVAAAATSWRTTQGFAFEGEVTGLYGELLVVGTKKGARSIQVDALDDASLEQLATTLAKSAPTAKPWNQSSSKVATGIAKRLQILKGGKLVPFELDARPEPEFYVAYFGAKWCGPCVRFSPRLVQIYQRLKATAPGRFEVIFVSDDESSADQLAYARSVDMPWPILKFSAVNSVTAFEQWRGRGIPCLVVVNREGDLLFHSYRGEEYLGPDDPIEKLGALMEATAKGPLVSPTLHRLALAQHRVAAAGGNRAAQPYHIDIKRGRPRTLGIAQVTATLTVDARGRVTDAEFTPELDAIVRNMLARQTEDWLFLPAIVNGKPQSSSLQLPINFAELPAGSDAADRIGSR